MNSITRRDGILLVVAFLAVGFYLAWATHRTDLGFSTDDAWIFQSYARTIAQEGEWAMVAGFPSSATTSPLYTILLIPNFLFGLGPFVWTFALGALTLAATGALAARIAEDYFADVPYIGWAAGLTVTLTWQMVWAAVSGLETLLLTTFLLVCYRMASRTSLTPPIDNDRQAFTQGLTMGLVCGLLALARPDGLLLVGLMGLLNLALWGYRHPKAYVLWGVGITIVIIALITPFLAWNYHVTDSITPVTGKAKMAEYAYMLNASLLSRYWTLGLPMLLGIQSPLLVGLVLGSYHLARRKEWFGLLPLLWAFALVTFYVTTLPLSNRYIMPILPMLTIIAVGGVGQLWQWGTTTLWRRILTRTYIFSLPCLLLGTAYFGASELYSWEVEAYNGDIVASAKWVAQNVPDDELMVAHDVGALGYFAPRPIMDTAGLVSPELIPYITDYPALAQIACERGATWMFAREYQRVFAYDDPRIERVYEAPISGETSRFIQPSDTGEEGPWKVIRVYRLHCDAASPDG